MNNENLIIDLIQQDLKHNQLVGGLANLGLNSKGLHYLDLMDVVSDLMQIPEEGRISDVWGQIYVKYMNESVNVDITHRAVSLRELAVTCYRELKELRNSI